MTLTFTHVEQIVRKRNEHPGVPVHAADALVLIRHGDKELVWRRAGGYSSGGRKMHVEPKLILQGHADDPYPRPRIVLQEGGRLSKLLLGTVAETVDTFFGIEGLAARIDPKRTLLVTDGAG